MSPVPPVASPPAGGGETKRRAPDDLGKSLIHSVAWVGGVKWLVQLPSWASTIVVARLLTPEDYGLVGMATVYLGLVRIISQFGIGDAIVALRDISEDQLKQINSVVLLFGTVLFALSWAMAFPLGWFYDAPQLPAVVMVMSTSFVISALGSVSGARLRKDLQFKLLSLMNGADTIIVSVSMIVFAWLGFRYWTLVIGGLLGGILKVTWVLMTLRTGYARPQWHSLRNILAFSWDIIVGRVTWYAYTNADFVVAGRVLGKVPLGAYSLAWTLSGMVPAKITDLISAVSPSYLAAVQDKPAELRRYLLKLTEGVSLLTFPATIGLAVVAEDAVLFALGEKWRIAIAPLQVLSVYQALRSITPLLFRVLMVTGDSRFAARNGLISLVLLPPAFYLGGMLYGTVGIAFAWMVVHPFVAQRAWRLAFRRMEMPASQYFGAVWPALSGSLAMAALVLLIRSMLPAEWPLGLRVGIQVVSGAATYAGFMFLLHREQLTQIQRLIKRVRE